jgi:hypothetical protein
VVRTISTTVDALNVVYRHFKPLLKCAGLRDIRRHDLLLTLNWFSIFWGTPA